MLYCMAGVKIKHIEALPKETLLLSANAKGRELLSKTRKLDGIRICAKPADLDDSLAQNTLTQRIDAIYTLLFKDIKLSDSYIKKGPYIQ